MEKNTSNPAGQSQGDSQQPPAHGATSTSHGDQSQSSTDDLQALKARLALLESENTEFKADNAKYRKRFHEQEAAAQKAQETALAEQGKFKELSEQQAKQIAELQPISERYNQLASLISEQITTQIKDWPQEVKALIPDTGTTSIEERLAQVKRVEPLVRKLAEQARTTNPGNGPNPTPSGGTPEARQQEMYQKLRSTGGYGNIR